MRSNLWMGVFAVLLTYGPSSAQTHSPTPPSGTDNGNWRLIGPTQAIAGGESGDVGRINTFAFHPKDPHTIYAATPAGGLWLTQDGGDIWRLISDQPQLSVQDLVIDPIAPNTMYMLTGDGEGSQGAAAQLGLSPPSIGVLKSVDGGQHWATTGLAFDPKKPGELVYGYRLAIGTAAPTVLIAATTKGLWRSADGGETWRAATPAKWFWDVQFHPTDSSIVYAASTEFVDSACATKVYRSTDAGETWTALQNGLPNADECSINARVRLAVTPARPDTLYALFGSNTGFTVGLYRSDDRGNTFTKRSSTEPLPKNGSALPLDLNKPNVFGYQYNDYGSQSFYSIAMAVAPDNVDLVHIGAVDNWRSEDGGVTWKRISYWTLNPSNWGGVAPRQDQYVHADIHTLAYHGGSLFAATDGGIYRSDDKGDSWQSITRMETGITIAQIYDVCASAQKPDVFYFGAQDNGFYQLDIDGTTRLLWGGDGFVCQADPRNSKIVYSEYVGGSLRKTMDASSTDSGKWPQWKLITPTEAGYYVRGPWSMPYILGPAAPASIYACYGDVWFSRNGGASWRNASKGTLGPSRECRQIAISPADPKTIYVVKEAEIDLRHRPGEGDARPPFLGGGGVFRSTDGGVTWHSITNNLPLGEAAVSNLSVSPTDARRVWVTFQGYKTDAKVFMTTDGGSTWINISSELPNIPAHCVAAAPGPANPVYVGMDDGVYYRDDTLGRWVSFKDGLPDQSNGRPISVTSLLIQEAQHRLVASTFAVGVWMSDLHR